MKKEKIQKLIEKLKENNFDEIIITDPLAIKYLTSIYIEPGERFYALRINSKGEINVFANKLFPPIEEDLNPVVYTDTDKPIESLKNLIKEARIIGIDKNMPARFLLNLMEGDKTYKLGSFMIDDLRAVKDLKEIEFMEEASRLNDEAMGKMEEKLSEDLSELEMCDFLDRVYKDLGAEDKSFETIVGYGEGSWDPHHMTNENKKEEGQSIVIDMGCVKNGYCSDMTRTFFYKSVSPEQEKIYNTVLKANLKGISMVKPNVKISDIDKAVRKIIEDAGYGQYFTHRTGHFIGMECHESGDISSTNDNFTKVGNIFSIEPGIYKPGVCGVRIEDLVLVTEDGVKVLNNYPKELKVIE